MSENPKPFTQTVEEAKFFAAAAHRNQKYGDEQFFFHLTMVARLAEPYGEKATMVAWLHDVIEDTAWRYEELHALFGEEVADAVRLASDGPGASRAERKAAACAKLKLAPTGLVHIAKPADRLGNVMYSIMTGNMKKFLMYKSEHRVFRDAAYRPGLCDALWASLDGLLSIPLKETA